MLKLPALHSIALKHCKSSTILVVVSKRNPTAFASSEQHIGSAVEIDLVKKLYSKEFIDCVTSKPCKIIFLDKSIPHV